ncbi:hypothetical protein [Aureimonas frigidaquae]|nr:hypothetical protein [Aureimonas frigidaquae]
MSNIRNWKPASQTSSTPEKPRAANENGMGSAGVEGKTLMPTADRPSAWLDGDTAKKSSASAPQKTSGQTGRSKSATVTYLVLGIAVAAILYFLSAPLMQMFGASGVVGVD